LRKIEGIDIERKSRMKIKIMKRRKSKMKIKSRTSQTPANRHSCSHS